MLEAMTPDQVEKLIEERISDCVRTEVVPIQKALGRILAADIISKEDIPGFDRTTVDGYALKAADTFGCTETIPALMKVVDSITMGSAPLKSIESGECMSIPTGGMLPQGADSAVMIEYTEDYGDGTIGILKPVAPGENLIFKGDDVKKDALLMRIGHRLKAHDIGALATLGYEDVEVFVSPKVGIISTGDELVPVNEVPKPGQIRDVNSSLIGALVQGCGGESITYGIIRDDEESLGEALDNALGECDFVVISGGSSVGVKDATCGVIKNRGELLLHGIAMKPGKPTILGDISGKLVFGLPGHPAAAFFVAQLFLRRAITMWMHTDIPTGKVKAILSESVSANHGRAQYTYVKLVEEADGLKAVPIHSKSGLITTLSASDGYVYIPREIEGLMPGTEVLVELFL